jgi:DNA-binding MarR family transcriptional regulator
MDQTGISKLSRALIQIGWYFGPNGVEGGWCSDLSLSEIIALNKIYQTNECSVKDVKTTLNYTKSGATRIVNRLEKKGYVQKVKAETDARFCCITATDKGEEVLRKADSIYADKFTDLLNTFPSEATEDIKDSFISVAKRLDDEI